MAEDPTPRREATEPSQQQQPPQSLDPAAPALAPAYGEAGKAQPPAAPDAAAPTDKSGKPPPSDAFNAAAEDNANLIASRQRTERNISYSFIGARFEGNTNFGAGAGVKDDQRYTWAEKLAVVDREHCAGHGDATDPLFSQACEALGEFRIVVLRHRQGGQNRAEAVLKRVSHWAGGLERPWKLLGIANHLLLPLDDLAAAGDWPEHFHHSLVMLERRHEPMTTRFLSSNNTVGVRSLCQRLSHSDSRLIIALAAEWDSGEGSLDLFDKSVKTLEVAAPDHAQPTSAVEMGESAFDALPRIAAGLFQGLKVDEFRTLVDELVEGLQTLPEPGAPDQDAKKPSSPPTRLQRWRAGEVDRVLTDLGVRYLVSSGDATSAWSGRATGYYLADERSPYAEPGWVIAHHPVLLAGRVDRLLDRHLGTAASDRYREAFLATLARLEGAGVREVTAEWLLKGWTRALSAQADVDVAAKNFCALVEYLQPSNATAVLARSVIDRLAADVVGSEIGFQGSAGAAPLARIFETAEEDEAVDGNVVWERLIDDPDAGPAARSLAERQTACLWALLRLSRRWPAEVVRAIARVLSEVSNAATPWRGMAKALEPLDAVPRFAALALDHVLRLSLSIAPDLWVAVGAGVAQVYEGAVRESLARVASGKRPGSQASEPLAIEGQRLAFACLYALAPRVYAGDGDQPHPLRLLNLIDAGGAAVSEGPALIGRLLAMSHLDVDIHPALGPAGQGELPAPDVVRFLRALTLGLQGGQAVSPEQVAGVLGPLAAGLRASLPLLHRRQLTQAARESLDSLFGARDHFEATGQRESLADMKRRIRATQAVVRSLAASATPVTDPTH